MSQPTFSPVSVVADTIVRTVELGVTITDAAIEAETTVVWCELLGRGPGRCPGCGTAGTYRDRVERRLTDLPVAGHPMQLRVRVPRYRCLQDGCERVIFCHDTRGWRGPGATTTLRCARYVLRRLVVDRVTVAAVARELGRSWDTVNTIAVEATTELLAAAGPARLDGVRVIGVDEHRWAHTRRAVGEGYVTVIVDLTSVVDGSGRARLLDLVAGRSAAALAGWLAERTPGFRGSGRDRGDGRVRRLQERRHQRRPRRGHRHGPLPRRRPGRGEAGPVPPARTAGHDRAPRSGR